MYTQCPDCLSVFSVNAQILARARGWMMCGHCDSRFDGIATLADQLPPEPFHELPAHASDMDPPSLHLAVFRPSTQARHAPGETASWGESSADTTPPSFACDRPRLGSVRWPWLGACLILLLGLAAQLGWALRDTLITDPHLGPWVWQACEVLSCRLPAVHDASKLHLLAREVRTHPSVPGALLISAALRNDALFTQPWPVLTLRLTDGRGKMIAMRRLHPYEYIDDSNALRRGFAPGASTTLIVETEDPGRRAVGFDIAFQ